MFSERQRIEASPSAAADNTMPSSSYNEEVGGVFTSRTYGGSADDMDYFLGEVTTILFSAFYWFDLFHYLNFNF